MGVGLSTKNDQVDEAEGRRYSPVLFLRKEIY